MRRREDYGQVDYVILCGNGKEGISKGTKGQNNAQESCDSVSRSNICWKWGSWGPVVGELHLGMPYYVRPNLA